MLATLVLLAAVVGCDDSTAGQFSLCAGTGNQIQTPGSPSSAVVAKPVRLCTYYANGTTDIPTDTIISAWVEVGSRSCIGDAIAEPTEAKPPRTYSDDLADKFTALSQRPYAWWEPGDEVEFEDPASFHLSRSDLQVSGELLSEAATIRFRAVSARWKFSDDQIGSGFVFTRTFPEVGSFQAFGFVLYEVDYRIAGGSWVTNAASWELAAQAIEVPVVEYPRRTLLVAG